MDCHGAASIERFANLTGDLVKCLHAACRREDAKVAPELWPRLPDHSWLRPLAYDVMAICDRDGEGADAIFMAVTGIDGIMREVVDAYRRDRDLSPWRRERDRVPDLLATMRPSSSTRPVVDAVAFRSAAPATPLVGVERRAAATAGEKGGEGEKVRRRRRRGSANPGGRPSKEADRLLRRVMQGIGDEARRDGLDVNRELADRVFCRTAEELAELIFDRLHKKIGGSTIRGSSILWKKWHAFRKAKGSPAEPPRGEISFDSDALHVGGARRTADDRRCDAETEAWAAANGVSLDDV